MLDIKQLYVLHNCVLQYHFKTKNNATLSIYEYATRHGNNYVVPVIRKTLMQRSIWLPCSKILLFSYEIKNIRRKCLFIRSVKKYLLSPVISWLGLTQCCRLVNYFFTLYYYMNFKILIPHKFLLFAVRLQCWNHQIK